MAIKHHTIPPAGTPNAIDEPQWAEGHDIDSAGITFNDTTVQVTAAVPYTAGTNVTITVASGTSSIAAPIAAGSNVTLTSLSGTLTIAAATGGPGVTAGTNITIATSGGTATIAAPIAASTGIALTSASGTLTIASAANVPYTAGLGISITAASGTSSIAVNQAANFVWSGTQTFTGVELVSTSTMTFDGAGALSIAGNLTVGGTATLSGQVRMTGTETISGPLLVSGTATFTNTVALSAMVEFGTQTLYAWGTGTNWPVLQFASMGGILGYGPTNQIVCIGDGAYYNGTNYIQGKVGTCVTWTLGSGSFAINIAASGVSANGTAMTQTVLSIGGTITNNKLTVYGPTAKALVDLTPDFGTFTATVNLGTGLTKTSVCVFNRVGGLVTLSIGGALGTMTGTNVTVGPIPAAILPTRTQLLPVPYGGILNAGVGINGTILLSAFATWTFCVNSVITFTNGGVAGVGTGQGTSTFSGFDITYSIL